MLQQILHDMYIEPELLSELSDEQKQILFYKMRQEQIRRFTLWVEKEDNLQQVNGKATSFSGFKKSVSFYCDDQDNVLVEEIHNHERKIEEFLKDEEKRALEQAEILSRKETEFIVDRKVQVAESSRAVSKEEKESIGRKSCNINSIVVGLVDAPKLLEVANYDDKQVKVTPEEEGILNEQTHEQEGSNVKCEFNLQRLQEERKLAFYEKIKLEQEAARQRDEEEHMRLLKEWEEREKKAKEEDQRRRNSVSYTRQEMRREQMLEKERALLNEYRKTETIETKEQAVCDNVGLKLRAAKYEDTKQKLSTHTDTKEARTPVKDKARHDKKMQRLSSKMKNKSAYSPVHATERLTISSPVNNVSRSQIQLNTIPVKREILKPTRSPPVPDKASSTSRDVKAKPAQPLRPKTKNEVAKWWRQVEYERHAGLDDNFLPFEWFHGIINRQEAESLLQGCKKGSFLVRVSERVWGYTVSYKDVERCKHFLIDTSATGYQFFGTQQMTHSLLNDLVEYHKENPISALGQEVLLWPCGQSKTPPDFHHLLVESTTI